MASHEVRDATGNCELEHAFSSTTGALLSEDSAALSLRPRSAKTMAGGGGKGRQV